MKTALSLLSALSLCFSTHLLASDVVQAPSSIAQLKTQILLQMKEGADDHAISPFSEHQQLQKDPSFFRGIWQGALIGAAATIMFVPAAIGAGVSRLVVGKGSGIGHNVMSGVVGFSAALGALPTAIIGIPVAPIGAGVGAVIGVKNTFDERHEVHEAVEKIWGHLAFVYNLLLIGELDFMELDEQERINQLTSLSDQLKKEIGHSSSPLRISQFITYDQTAENRLRANAMNSILKSSAFKTAQGQYLDQDTLNTFIDYLHRGKPVHVSDAQSKEAALLVIRFIKTYLSYSAINVADAVIELVEKS